MQKESTSDISQWKREDRDYYCYTSTQDNLDRSLLTFEGEESSLIRIINHPLKRRTGWIACCIIEQESGLDIRAGADRMFWRARRERESQTAEQNRARASSNSSKKESSTNTKHHWQWSGGISGCGRCHTDFSALGCFYSSSSYCDGSDSSQTSEATNPLSAVERPSNSEICAPTLLLKKSRCTRAICLQVSLQPNHSKRTNQATHAAIARREHASHCCSKTKTDYAPPATTTVLIQSFCSLRKTRIPCLIGSIHRINLCQPFHF
jgi:hypothetical protein